MKPDKHNQRRQRPTLVLLLAFSMLSVLVLPSSLDAQVWQNLQQMIKNVKKQATQTKQAIQYTAGIGRPVITSVSPIYQEKWQTIVIRGSGFGMHQPFNGCSPFLMVQDVKANWEAGLGWSGPNCYGPSAGIYVKSWTNTEIVIGGFSSLTLPYRRILEPGNTVLIEVGNAQQRAGILPPWTTYDSYTATYQHPPTPAASFSVTVAPGEVAPGRSATVETTSGSAPGGPVITSVSPIYQEKWRTIVIRGSSFGMHQPFNGCSPFLMVQDVKANWEAGLGWSGPNCYGPSAGIYVKSWTNTEIVIGGFSSLALPYGRILEPGNTVLIEVGNAQAQAGILPPWTTYDSYMATYQHPPTPAAWYALGVTLPGETAGSSTAGNQSGNGASSPSPQPSGNSAAVSSTSSPSVGAVTLTVAPQSVTEGAQFTASGTVTGTDGSGLSGEAVQLSATVGSTTLALTTVITGAAGSFSAALNAPPVTGPATITASVEGSSPLKQATTQLDVTANQTSTASSPPSASASALKVDSVVAVGEPAIYTIVLPPESAVCSSGPSLSDQTKKTSAFCPPTYDYIQIAGSNVVVEGSTATIQVTFTNTTGSVQQAPACISVTPESSGNASWWTFPASSQVTAPPASAVFTSADRCPDGSSKNEASLKGGRTVGAGNTMTLSYIGTAQWTEFTLKPESSWNSVVDDVETSLGVTSHAAEAAALDDLPEVLATTAEVAGVATSAAANALSFANGLINLGAVEAVPWVTYTVQVQGGSPYTFQEYAQPEKMVVLDTFLWSLKWHMIPYVGSYSTIAAAILDGLQEISLGKSDCVYQIASSSGSDGPSYSWFYDELESSGSDKVPSSTKLHLGNYVNLGACTWTGWE